MCDEKKELIRIIEKEATDNMAKHLLKMYMKLKKDELVLE